MAPAGAAFGNWTAGGFRWIGFRKAFGWVRADLLYLTEPLILLVGAGRFELPTPCAQGKEPNPMCLRFQWEDCRNSRN
jgi:hypothetical protein